MADELGRTKPRIAVAAGGGRGKDPSVNGIAVTTIGMQPGEEKIAADKIYKILTAKRAPISTEMQAPSQSLAGSWDVDVKFSSSSAKHKLFIEQDCNWIKGGHKTTFAVSDLSGSIEGNQIRLQSALRLIGDHVPYTFTGTVTGDQMTGSIFMGEYRSAKFTAVRDKKASPKKKIFVPSGAPLAS